MLKNSNDIDDDLGAQVEFAKLSSAFESICGNENFIKNLIALQKVVQSIWEYKIDGENTYLLSKHLADIKDDKSQEGLIQRWAMYEIYKLSTAKNSS